MKKLKQLDVGLDGIQEGGKDDDGVDTDTAIVAGELSVLIPTCWKPWAASCRRGVRPQARGRADYETGADLTVA